MKNRNYSREHQVFLAIVNDAADAGRWRGQVDEERLITLLDEHRLYPIVSESAVAAYPQVAAWIREEKQYNAFEMLALTRSLVQLVQQFDAAGVRYLCLKGPVIALRLYGDLSQRTSRDLDVVVDIAQ
ncbi:MAG: nucleotidyltransferase family protein, partial [Bacilli bacterium]